MQITNIKAFPISYRVPEGENVRLGIGLAVKRDAVLIKVETSEGVTGWGVPPRKVSRGDRQAD